MHTSEKRHHALPASGRENGSPKRMLKRKRNPECEYQWCWSCDNCGTQGGMSLFIQHCPGCQHARCTGCPVEVFRPRDPGCNQSQKRLKVGSLHAEWSYTGAPKVIGPGPEYPSGHDSKMTLVEYVHKDPNF